MLCSNFPSAAGEHQRKSSDGRPADSQLLPGNTKVHPRTQSFCSRLFCRKPGRKALRVISLTPAIGYFLGSEDANKKSVAKSFYRLGDPLDLNQIDSRPQQHADNSTMEIPAPKHGYQSN